MYIVYNILYITLYGGIAQLGECLTGSQKVTGSSPVISTRNLISIFSGVLQFFYNKTVIIMTLLNLEKNNNTVL